MTKERYTPKRRKFQHLTREKWAQIEILPKQRLAKIEAAKARPFAFQNALPVQKLNDCERFAAAAPFTRLATFSTERQNFLEQMFVENIDNSKNRL